MLLLLIPAAISCFFEYSIFVRYTLDAPGAYWRDGRPMATDFVQFAAVAEAWKQGRIDEIYESVEKQREFETKAAGLPKPYADTLTFNYPPFTLWLFKPLGFMPYQLRYVCWVLMQFCFALVGLWCWRKELNPGAFGVVALAWFMSPPVINTFILGHQAFMAMGIVSVVMYLLNRSRDLAAGLALSLLLYKPPLGIVIGPLIFLAGRWKTVLGVLMGACGLVVASLAVSLKACQDYRGMGKILLELASTTEDFYAKHFNLLAFVATFFELRIVDFTWMHWALVLTPSVMLIALAAKAWCFPWRPGTLEWSAGASSVLLTTIVVTPYLYSYDTMLAAVAGVYSVRTWSARPEWHRWFILACVAITGYCVGRDILMMEDMQRSWGFRLQFTPIVFAAWATLEACWAISRRR